MIGVEIRCVAEAKSDLACSPAQSYTFPLNRITRLANDVLRVSCLRLWFSARKKLHLYNLQQVWRSGVV